MAYQMTEDFAGTMVTVIPVIMVVGTVEFQTILQRKAADPPPTGVTTRQNLVRMLTGVMQLFVYGLLISTHAEAEVRLIVWLAEPKHEPDPELAKQTVWVSCAGFLFVAVYATLILLLKQLALFMEWFRFDLAPAWATQDTRARRAPAARVHRSRTPTTPRVAPQRAPRAAQPPRPRTVRLPRPRSGARRQRPGPPTGR